MLLLLLLPDFSPVRPDLSALSIIARQPAMKHRLPSLFPMLPYALLFLIIAVIAAVIGFAGVAGAVAWVAKILCFVFLVLAGAAFLSVPRDTL